MKKLLTLLFVSGFLFGQDTKEKMRSIVDSYSLQDYQSKLNDFHNYNNLPDKNLNKAIKKYANTVKKDDVLIFHYSGLGFIGYSFIVTNDKLYYLNNVNPSPAKSSGEIKLQSITEFKWVGVDDVIYIYNGANIVGVIRITGYNKYIAPVLISLLDKIVNETKQEAAKNYVAVPDSSWTLKSIQSNCPDVGTSEICDETPFSEFTIRGSEGNEEDDGRWWWVNDNTLGLSNYDSGNNNSGATEIHIRDGYQVKIKFQFETKGDRDFLDDIFPKISEIKDGIVEVGDDYFIALLSGGDQLSVDIDDEWSGIPPFFLKAQGSIVAKADSKNGSIDDEVYISLLEVGSGSNALGSGSGKLFDFNRKSIDGHVFSFGNGKTKEEAIKNALSEATLTMLRVLTEEDRKAAEAAKKAKEEAEAVQKAKEEAERKAAAVKAAVEEALSKAPAKEAQRKLEKQVAEAKKAAEAAAKKAKEEAEKQAAAAKTLSKKVNNFIKDQISDYQVIKEYDNGNSTSIILSSIIPKRELADIFQLKVQEQNVSLFAEVLNDNTKELEKIEYHTFLQFFSAYTNTNNMYDLSLFEYEKPIKSNLDSVYVIKNKIALSLNSNFSSFMDILSTFLHLHADETYILDEVGFSIKPIDQYHREREEFDYRYDFSFFIRYQLLKKGLDNLFGQETWEISPQSSELNKAFLEGIGSPVDEKIADEIAILINQLNEKKLPWRETEKKTYELQAKLLGGGTSFDFIGHRRSNTRIQGNSLVFFLDSNGDWLTQTDGGKRAISNSYDYFTLVKAFKLKSFETPSLINKYINNRIWMIGFETKFGLTDDSDDRLNTIINFDVDYMTDDLFFRINTDNEDGLNTYVIYNEDFIRIGGYDPLNAPPLYGESETYTPYDFRYFMKMAEVGEGTSSHSVFNVISNNYNHHFRLSAGFNLTENYFGKIKSIDVTVLSSQQIIDKDKEEADRRAYKKAAAKAKREAERVVAAVAGAKRQAEEGAKRAAQHSSGCYYSGARSYASSNLMGRNFIVRSVDLYQESPNQWQFYAFVYINRLSTDAQVIITIGCSGGSYSVRSFEVVG